MQSAISAHSGLIHRTKALQESIPGKIVLAFAATWLVAACAHISLPLPFTPVPLTLQNFAVLLVGMALGPVAGFSAMVLYLAQGAMGLPMAQRLAERLRATSPVNFWLVNGCIAPCILMLGGKSLDMNRSDPPALLIAVSNLVIWALACSSVRLGILFL